MELSKPVILVTTLWSVFHAHTSTNIIQIFIFNIVGKYSEAKMEREGPTHQHRFGHDMFLSGNFYI